MRREGKPVNTVIADKIDHLSRSESGQAAFFAAAVATMDRDDLKEADPDRLLARLARTYEDARLFEGETNTIQIDRNDTQGGRQRISVVSPDMPFIVDSTLAAIRATGASVRLFAHPRVHRQSDGTIDYRADADGRALSILHVEIDPIADVDTLRAELEATFADVRPAVADWQSMRQMTLDLAETLEGRRGRNEASDEAAALLTWLCDNNFTFVGLREYDLVNGDPVPVSGLGILGDEKTKFLRSGSQFVESTPEHTDFLNGPDPVIVTKANIRSRVHRRTHLDFVAVKRFGPDGSVVGEVRILGLFTSRAIAAPHTEVPIVRRKIRDVLRRSGFEAASHDRRALLGALMAYPRDELFQIEIPLLTEYAGVIAALADRPRVRVLPRIDRYDNFVSVLIYIPRDRYDADVRARVVSYLAERYDGRVSAYYPNFLGELVRVHLIIGRDAGETPEPARAELERRIEDLCLGFGERLLAAADAPDTVNVYRHGFSAAYQARNSVADALADSVRFETLADAEALAIALDTTTEIPDGLRLRFYHLGSAIPLSDRVPMLEEFGFSVIEERTFTIDGTDGTVRYIHDMVLKAPATAVDVSALARVLEPAVLAVWQGECESDGLNALTLFEGLEWPDIAVLRAFSRYLRQVGISYSQRYLARVLTTHHRAARALVALFHALHDPSGHRGAEAEEARNKIAATRDAATSLDEDRILARFANVIEASLRTNYFQRDEGVRRRPALAIKFDCDLVQSMPAPRPYREIFVYAPRVEGIHLRFGPIARGGLRWSDRPEDFRTEVLGLVKAQQVKNAVIVPVGAKGGFVPKQLTLDMTREARQAEGIACYKLFIGAMLDITDNRVGGGISAPNDTVRRDGDDPYLVVAADKGTASFSDTANAIAVERSYWLDDAFASGGSAGYDHKEMGITARGGWECVKRHFREMDRDIQSEPFTVAGVGDMSGDVFGNGMLQSRQIRLMAAFDHRDIFLDPDPDPAVSFSERQRLFETPRSSWQDYDRALISPSGGVFSRSAKAVPLDDRLRVLLGLEGESATPNAVISAILSLDVDLLWFGGIGTYVRASNERDQDVGDRANDAIRVSGDKVRAKVVGEGANLGVTQQGRVEYALGGGRINTDAIDNSAGVNSSDLEVNIKVALRPLQEDGRLDDDVRNAFLTEMTDDVAELCLRNNYLQSLAISLAERAGLSELPDLRDLMTTLESEGRLDPTVEFLPDAAALDNRLGRNIGFTRPELAVLLAYAKLDLKADLLTSDVLDDPYLSGELPRYFPDRLAERFPQAVANHRLRRELIATVLSNAIINRGGPAIARELMNMSSAGAGDVALAYAATRDIYGLAELNTEIDVLDGTIAGAVQLDLYSDVQALLRRGVLWFLRNAELGNDAEALVLRHRAGVDILSALLADILPPDEVARTNHVSQELESGGVPSSLAHRIANLGTLAHASDVVLVGERTGASLPETAHAFFEISSLFNLWSVSEQGRELVLLDRFDRMALDRALANLTRAQRDLAADVLAMPGTDIALRLNAWRESRTEAVERTVVSVGELTQGTLTVSRLSVAAGLLTDLASGS